MSGDISDVLPLPPSRLSRVPTLLLQLVADVCRRQANGSCFGSAAGNYVTLNAPAGNTLTYIPTTDYLPWVDQNGDAMTLGRSFTSAYGDFHLASGTRIDLVGAGRPTPPGSYVVAVDTPYVLGRSAAPVRRSGRMRMKLAAARPIRRPTKATTAVVTPNSTGASQSE